MNRTHLAALVELESRRTMVAAAAELGYTPGAVSQQIAALERAVGAALIAKVGRNVVLTDAGTVLAAHARRILRAERAALDAVRAVEGEVAAPLTLGAFGSTAAALLPPVVAAARLRHPRLELRSRELDVDDVVTAVQHGQVDAAFGLDYPHNPMPRSVDVEMITLRSERFAVAVTPGVYGVRSGGTIALADAAGWRWIMPPEHTQFGHAVRAACREAGFEPDVRHEITDTAVSLSLAGKGLGATFVTDLMAELNPSAPIVRVALAQPVDRRIVLVRMAGAAVRPTVRAVTEVVRAVVAGEPGREHPDVPPDR